jgi:hypothetical protein
VRHDIVRSAIIRTIEAEKSLVLPLARSLRVRVTAGGGLLHTRATGKNVRTLQCGALQALPCFLCLIWDPRSVQWRACAPLSCWIAEIQSSEVFAMVNENGGHETAGFDECDLAGVSEVAGTNFKQPACTFSIWSHGPRALISGGRRQLSGWMDPLNDGRKFLSAASYLPALAHCLLAAIPWFCRLLGGPLCIETAFLIEKDWDKVMLKDWRVTKTLVSQTLPITCKLLFPKAVT